MKTIKLSAIAVAFLTIFSCSHEMECPKPEPPTQPKSMITLDEARKQLGNYNTAHPGVRGEQFALRTWVSIEDLENYIAYMKEESKKKGIVVNGIDFIYTQTKEGNPGMANQNNADYELTFMYAPTFKQGTSNVAFDPMSSTQGNPALLKDLLAPQDSTQNKTESTNGGPSGIANHYGACPTICP